MIVDTHTHLVSEDPERYPLQPAGLPGKWYLEAPVSAEGLLERMDENGVDRAVAVQPMGAYSYDNRYAADSAERFPERLAGVCCVDVRSPDALSELDLWIGRRRMQGLRLFALAPEGESWLGEPATFPVWERVADLGAPLIATVFSHQLAELRRMLERFRDVSVLLDHCGFPQLHGPGWTSSGPLLDGPRWDSARPLFDLADAPNLYLKVSTHVLDEAERVGELGDFVAALAERFGARRLMWGSDFPQTHDRSYAQLVDWGRQAFSGLAPEDRDQVLARTALGFWPPPGPQ